MPHTNKPLSRRVVRARHLLEQVTPDSVQQAFKKGKSEQEVMKDVLKLACESLDKDP